MIHGPVVATIAGVEVRLHPQFVQYEVEWSAREITVDLDLPDVDPGRMAQLWARSEEAIARRKRELVEHLMILGPQTKPRKR
jgi:hypothetical protein